MMRLLAAADLAKQLHFDDVPPAIWGALSLCLVLAVVLALVRSRLHSQTGKDLLGITAAFLVLVLVTFAMILGEHSLG